MAVMKVGCLVGEMVDLQVGKMVEMWAGKKVEWLVVKRVEMKVEMKGSKMGDLQVVYQV